MTNGKDMRSQASVVVEAVCDHVVEIDLARPRVGAGVDSMLCCALRFVGEAFVGDSSGCED